MINLKRLAMSGMAVVFLNAPSNCVGDELLPKAEEIIKKAVKRSELEAQNDIDFKQKYYFVRSKLTEIRNFEGELKKSDSRISTNFPPKKIVAPEPESAGTPVVRSPKAEQLASAGANKAAARKFDKNQFQFNDDLVGRYDFKLVGREVTNGYSLLVLDFTPKKKKLPESGIRDRLMNAAGESAARKCPVKSSSPCCSNAKYMLRNDSLSSRVRERLNSLPFARAPVRIPRSCSVTRNVLARSLLFKTTAVISLRPTRSPQRLMSSP